MKQRPRIYYSDTQKALMWDRWEKGDSMHTIARLFDRGHASVQRILAETGGIRPPPRSRSRLSLTLAEREEISRDLVAGNSIRSIAASLGRAPSTVSREVNRNGGRRHYRASLAFIFSGKCVRVNKQIKRPLGSLPVLRLTDRAKQTCGSALARDQRCRTQACPHCQLKWRR